MEGKIIYEVREKDLLSLLEKVKFTDKLLTHEEVRTELNIKRSQYGVLKKSGLLPVRGLGTLERVLKSELYDSFEILHKYLETP